MDDTPYPDDEPHFDVCQHCGRIFAWTADITEAWERTYPELAAHHPPPQRCRKCIINECWIEED